MTLQQTPKPRIEKRGAELWKVYPNGREVKLPYTSETDASAIVKAIKPRKQK